MERNPCLARSNWYEERRVVRRWSGDGDGGYEEGAEEGDDEYVEGDIDEGDGLMGGSRLFDGYKGVKLLSDRVLR